MLASPQFLFLVEPEETREDRPLTEFELASRLSYFLWSSMPDDELFREAREGTLRSNLRRQVVRMLDDPRSDEFVENFAGQWLQLRKLAGVARDKDLFPGFDDTLREAMRKETEQYFAYILRNNRSVLELLDSDYTFVNEALARHYGIEGVTGDEFRQVALADRRRGGVLTQASVLTLTSNPNRTSPVKRGQWILQQILGTPPPPPPPDVAKLDESQQAADAASLRERMEVHRTKPECASCHQQMDPLGFALENYDAVGRWRTMDGEFPIDPVRRADRGTQVRRRQGAEAAPGVHGRQEIREVPRREHVNLWPGTWAGSLRLLHGRGDPQAARRQRLPDSAHHLRDRGKPGVPVSGRRPMIESIRTSDGCPHFSCHRGEMT